MKMPRLHIFAVPLMVVLLVGLLVTLYAISRSDKDRRLNDRAYPFLFEDTIVARIAPKSPFFVADVDLDGNDDLLIDELDRLLWYRFHENRMILAGEGVYRGPGSTRFVADANGDGRPEFFVCTEETKRSMLSCHDWFSPAGPSVPLYTIGPLLGPQKIEDWGARRNKINFLGCSAAEKGGSATLFIGNNPVRYENLSRSLVAYDAATGRKMWDFHFAAMSVALVCDHSGTDTPRVFLTTAAVSNGISHDGMTDDFSYLFCLDERDGRLIWKKEVTGISGRSYPAIADLDCDGQNEVLLLRYLSPLDSIYPRKKAPWIAAAMNRDGAALSAVSLPRSGRSICTADLDGDGYPEVLISGINGEIVILNHDLTIRAINTPPKNALGTRLKIIGVRDLTNDGVPEILCRLENKLSVHDCNGTKIAERSFDKLGDALPVSFNGKNHVAATSRDSIHIMILKRTPILARAFAHWRPLTVGAAVAAFVGVWVVFHGRRMLKRRREKHITFDEAQNDLLMAMAAYGHGGSSLKIVDRIRLHLKNWNRVQSDAAAREELFAKLHATFAETIVPELMHIVMLAHRADVPEGIWGAIVPRAEIADKAMDAIVAAGSANPAAGREAHIAAALSTLDTVDESISKLRSYLRSVFRTPVVEALERAVARYWDEHGGRRIPLSLPSDAEVAEGVFVSPVAFDKILESLLANSGRAIEGRSDAAIAIEVQWEGDYYKIDIRDNGCGIPRVDWERAFERSYTTKEAGGFGLYYARETLARFGGKIFVLDSVIGSGTTMRMVLRKS